jgi:hypothetical protein
MGLQTTAYATLMAGSINGPVVVPGDPEASKLWEMIGSGKMPLTGPLPMDQRQLVYDWIKAGAAERRAPAPVPRRRRTRQPDRSYQTTAATPGSLSARASSWRASPMRARLPPTSRSMSAAT